jgi:hypothetical protein
MIHPYWTPKDYICDKISLEWRSVPSAGAAKEPGNRNLFVSLAAGRENPGSAFAQASVSWNRTTGKTWGFEIDGMVYKSRSWSCSRLTLGINRRFL